MRGSSLLLEAQSTACEGHEAGGVARDLPGGPGQVCRQAWEQGPVGGGVEDLSAGESRWVLQAVRVLAALGSAAACSPSCPVGPAPPTASRSSTPSLGGPAPNSHVQPSTLCICPSMQVRPNTSWGAVEAAPPPGGQAQLTDHCADSMSAWAPVLPADVVLLLLSSTSLVSPMCRAGEPKGWGRPPPAMVP